MDDESVSLNLSQYSYFANNDRSGNWLNKLARVIENTYKLDDDKSELS